ncbi:lachesin isoform X2 [Eurytemora carolleeae]|uniref:lachesin isoform X2 n=1 Tax=Eurytemora carolleeae TaxID=1294199 RepID=UPI000C75623C|nr:lachesin isoform X2 [Eurytemora carolleeae]|eukprot:XP_023341856.1 lachesin-like isoform X2 [Eurytemora affinis]
MKTTLTPLLLFLVFITKGEGMKPRFVDEIRNITVEVGRDATFTCTVSDIHGYRVGWVKANTKAIQVIGTHVITHNNRVSVSHDESRRKWSLHIAEAQLEDTGPYMCQLNTDPMLFKMGYLDVVITPDIVDIRGPSTVIEGGVARLECEARGEPAPMVFWQRENTREKITTLNKKDGTKQRAVRVEGADLHLQKITREMAGGYLCIASNGHPPAVSRRIQLDVKFRPIVTVPNQHIRGVLGKTIGLECEIESFPRAEISWVKRDPPYDPIETGGRFIKEDFHSTDYKTKSVLTIYNYTNQDSGLYTCKARNEMNIKGDSVDAIIYLNSEREYSTHDDRTTPDPYLILTDYEFSQLPYDPTFSHNTENPYWMVSNKSPTVPRSKKPPTTDRRVLNSAPTSQRLETFIFFLLLSVILID